MVLLIQYRDAVRLAENCNMNKKTVSAKKEPEGSL
jgi:hypothetical protein